MWSERKLSISDSRIIVFGIINFFAQYYFLNIITRTDENYKKKWNMISLISSIVCLAMVNNLEMENICLWFCFSSRYLMGLITTLIFSYPFTQNLSFLRFISFFFFSSHLITYHISHFIWINLLIKHLFKHLLYKNLYFFCFLN